MMRWRYSSETTADRAQKWQLRWLFVFAALLILFGGRAFAQEATIVGTITDPTGAVVPNATITITNLDTGQPHTFAANASGEYVAPDLGIGHYSIKVSARSFKTSQKSGVTLTVGDRLRQD
ncbi:MAG TPA: carboxypeptidase-like regulatory domain-containing protein, partial [Acidobacteriaceae bacterium]|nr:carboxypeptidase-like regulatory domain-containing protein [Acidobacteriaceae bacterium]